MSDLLTEKKSVKPLLKIKIDKYPSYLVPIGEIEHIDKTVCVKHNSEIIESLILDDLYVHLSSAKISSFLITGILELPSRITHVIAPSYLCDKTKIRIDSGISINGKCIVGEDLLHAMKREIAEEVGIFVGTPHKLNKGNAIFLAKDCCKYDDIHIKELEYEGTDDYRKRISCMIVGTYDECIDLVIKSRKLLPSDEENYGVSVLPISICTNIEYLEEVLKK